MKRIFLFGETGFLGGRIYDYLQQQGHDIQTLKADVRDVESVRQVLHGITGQVVINATGRTGTPNVDWCEEHRLETAEVNIAGAINVAKIASSHDNFVIQMGSGCIFEGDNEGRGFSEEDQPNFFGSFYSQTKAVAECALREIPNVCILRIRMPLSSEPHQKNLLTKLLQYQKILNVPNSVTVIEDFLVFLEKVIEKRTHGVLNAVNPGIYHHRDLLELYQKIVGDPRQFEYITLNQFQGMTKARRSNCVLSTLKTEKMGIAMPRIEESLQRVVEGYCKIIYAQNLR